MSPDTLTVGQRTLDTANSVVRRSGWFSSLFGGGKKADAPTIDPEFTYKTPPPREVGDVFEIDIREIRSRQAFVEGRLVGGEFKVNGQYSEEINPRYGNASIPQVYWVDWVDGEQPFWALLDGNHRTVDAWTRGLSHIKVQVGDNPPHKARNALWADKPYIPFADTQLWEGEDYVGKLGERYVMRKPLGGSVGQLISSYAGRIQRKGLTIGGQDRFEAEAEANERAILQLASGINAEPLAPSAASGNQLRRRAADGDEGFAAYFWERVKDGWVRDQIFAYGEGLGTGVKNAVEGTLDAVLHPIDTLTATADAIVNYERTFEAIQAKIDEYQEAAGGDPQKFAQMTGVLVGELLVAIAAAKGANAVSQGNKAQAVKAAAAQTLVRVEAIAAAVQAMRRLGAPFGEITDVLRDKLGAENRGALDRALLQQARQELAQRDRLSVLATDRLRALDPRFENLKTIDLKLSRDYGNVADEALVDKIVARATAIELGAGRPWPPSPSALPDANPFQLVNDPGGLDLFRGGSRNGGRIQGAQATDVGDQIRIDGERFPDQRYVATSGNPEVALDYAKARILNGQSQVAYVHRIRVADESRVLDWRTEGGDYGGKAVEVEFRVLGDVDEKAIVETWEVRNLGAPDYPAWDIQPAARGPESLEIRLKRMGAFANTIRTKHTGGGAGGGVLPGFESVLNRSQGSALPAGVQGRMEGWLGADFSNVRVHRDEAAHQAAVALNAKAFTVGTDVYFRRGAFDPNTPSGLALIGHELTHVAQNTGGAATIQRSEERHARRRGLSIGGMDRYEAQADANEDVIRRAATSQDLGPRRGLLGRTSNLLRNPMGAFKPSFKREDDDSEPSTDLVSVPPDPEIDEAVDLFRAAVPYLGAGAELAISCTPVVGDVYDGLCGLTGRSLITGENLDVLDRLLCFVGLVPIPFVSGALLRRGKRVIQWLVGEAKIIRAFNSVVKRVIGFVKRSFRAIRDWIGRVMMPKAGKAVEADLLREQRQAANAADQHLAEYIAKRKGEGTFEHITQSSYYEYKALRAQGYSASEAKGLMNRFRAGEEVDGFVFHFADSRKASNITRNNTLFSGGGLIGRGVYVGTTPTPNKWVLRTPFVAWGTDLSSNIRIPIKVNDRPMHTANLFPIKTKVFEVTDNMPLAGTADDMKDIMVQDGVIKRFVSHHSLDAFMLGSGAFLLRFLPMFRKASDGENPLRFADQIAAGFRPDAANLSMREVLDELEALANTDDVHGPAGRPRAGELRPQQPLGDYADALHEHGGVTRDLSRAVQELDKPGFGLDLSVRSRLESFLGEDLGSVRLHTGLAAERLSESIQADAFTLGTHVFLGAGQSLDEPEGLGLLAHEATHVVQHEQGRTLGPSTPGKVLSLESEAYAREREFVAQASAPPTPSLADQAPEAVVRSAPPTSEDIPNTLPTKTVDKVLSADANRKRVKADIVEQVMLDWQVTGQSREEFLEDLRERLLELIHDEAEYDNERRETLAWNYNLPQA